MATQYIQMPIHQKVNAKVKLKILFLFLTFQPSSTLLTFYY